MQVKVKLMNKIWEIVKKLILELILARLPQIWGQSFFFVILPLQVVKHCSKLLSYVI